MSSIITILVFHLTIVWTIKTDIYCDYRKHEFYLPQGDFCKRCDRCPPGFGMEELKDRKVEFDPVHGALECRRCAACSPGCFSKTRSFKECRLCRKCTSEGRVELRKCTQTSNAKCGNILPDLSHQIRLTDYSDSETVHVHLRNEKTDEGDAVLDNKGKEFLVAFMENEVIHGNDINPEIYITTSKKKIVHVNVSASGVPNSQLYKTFSVIHGQTQLVKLNTSFRLHNTELTKKAVLIQADDEIVVYAVNREEKSDDVYLALPIDALGKEYYTASYHPATHYCLFAIIGVYDETNVSIHLPHIHHLSVTINGHTYHGSQWINVTLDRFRTLEVRSKHDLTGSHILSSKPVGVLSGNKKTTIGHGSTHDHLVEMLLPLSSWGNNFATVPIPDRHGIGDMFRFIASEDNTHIHVSGINSGKPFQDHIKLSKAGHYVQKHYSSGLYSHIIADKAISVFQFSLTQKGHGDYADPSMISVIPIEQYAFEYTFTTPEYSHGNYSNYFMFIIDSSQTNGLRIDNRSLAGDQVYHKIPETHLVGGYMKISVGTHSVTHTDPTTVFGGILFGKANAESYGFPVGFLLKPINTDCLASPMIEGDKIDNDCDGEVDEEKSDGKDNDGDGQIDEDCRCCPLSGPKLPEIFGRR